jgi:uncharacterized ubiquitin-like protein YukD
MERIIVTVKKHQEARVRDLEIPAGVEVARLTELIASALHWDRDSAGGTVRYQIEAQPPGRVLEPDETLIDAGVRDGAWLTFIPEGQPQKGPTPPEAEAPAVPPAGGPVIKWESLFPDGTAEPEGEPPDTDEPPSSPYVWKEVDL